ncbi:MAG: N-6 DNA methylase [Gemmatimonadetes bacterium]|nr:N-6 DNA methylase [Gemmatimonadota bacterium]
MLGDLLASIRTARDAAPLFAALGYACDPQPLEDASWLVGRWRTFEVLACEAPDPRAGARSLAAKLESSSRRALVAAIGAGELALAAPRLGTGGSTRVQSVSLDKPQAGALRLLESLRPDGCPNALAHAIRVAELLSTETVGERFFVAFRQILGRMAAVLPRRGTPVERRTAALLPLTRILFLYFVQAKGWLDGRPDYLRRLLDASLARRKHFHRSALHPLFFGSLNRPSARRTGVARLGAIPYLNGGLFEPHPVERRFGPILFPNNLWRDAFDLLFERFRFCVREADEVDAIAPDMLGRVFERVMDDRDRKDTGTFYTPESVVRQIVDAAIESSLTTRLGSVDVRRLLQGSAQDLANRDLARTALQRLKLLDPAAGSGAFLLGALDRLTEIRVALDPELGRDRSRVRRDILAANLFGVDLSPIAVRLAELRLWLAVIADDPTAEIAHVTPLPNLDGVVRQGDSLLDPVGAARAWYAGARLPAAATARAVSLARRALFGASGEGLHHATARLRGKECDLAGVLVTRAAETADRALRELASLARNPDLFGRSSGLSKSQRERCRLLLRHRAALQSVQVAIADGQVPFFAFEVHAPEVMAAGGFDIVVGNPPWVRAERVPAGLRDTLRQRFGWWRSSGGRGFAHLPDLSVAFLERALELAAPGGVVAMLVPAKLASADYGETARRHLVAETRLAYLHRIPEREADSFGATTYPLAVVLSKSRPSSSQHVKLGFRSGEALTQSRLAVPGPWILVPDRQRDALEQLLAAGRPLREIAPPALGVKTGADDLFVGALIGRHGPIARLRLAAQEVSIEWEMLRPAIRGRDVRRFGVRLDKALIWTHDAGGAPLESLPPLAAAYFRSHLPRLQARADYQDGPPWTLFRTPARPSGCRMVWSDIARRPVAALLEACGVPRAVPLNTCYTLGTGDRDTALAIAAVFNSVWCAALARVTADEARGGYRRINVRVAAAFPVPPFGPGTLRLASLSASAHERTDVSADDLDEAVADAFDLPAAVRQTLRSLAAHRR